MRQWIWRLVSFIGFPFLHVFLLSGCGVGLCVEGPGLCHGPSSSVVLPKFLITGLEGLSVRLNDCYPVTLSVDSSSADTQANFPLQVSLSASSGVVLYQSLSGCETYDSSQEKNVFSLASATAQVVFYFRADTEGSLSISAAASNATVSDTTQSVTITSSPFDATTGIDNTVATPVTTVLFDSRGRTYVGGSFLFYHNSIVGGLLRLHVDGSLDTGFLPPSTGFTGQVVALAIQADEKVVVGGGFSSFAGTTRSRVARLNSDSTLDTGFSATGTGLTGGQVNAISLQTDGKVLLGGTFTAYNGTSTPYAARLNSDGSLDTTFAQAGTGLNGSVMAAALQSDGKWVVGGTFTSYNGTARAYVARLNSDGTLDPSFAQTGSGLSAQVNALAIQTDGSVIVGGAFTTYNVTSRPYLARLNSDGTLDGSFAQTGSGLSSWVLSLSLQSDGKVVVGGFFSTYNAVAAPYIARINSDGTRDTGFAGGSAGFNNNVRRLSISSDGKIFAGGDFDTFNGSSAGRMAQLNADGTQDTSAALGTLGLGAAVSAIAAGSDGSLVVGGSFTTYSGLSRRYLARFGANGAFDSSFAQTGTGLSGNVSALAVQTDGKPIAAGSFTTYNGTSRPAVARMNTDGSLDTSFAQTGSGFIGVLMAVGIQADGRVMVGGNLFDYDGTSTPHVARLNSDGSLDTSFTQIGSGLNSAVLAMQLQSDGKVVVGGSFTDYNGTARGRIARLNTDGSLDTTFTPTGTGLGGNVSRVELQSDGKLIVGGAFTTYNGTSRPYVARLNSDGTLDSTFAPVGTGLNNAVLASATQPDGKIVLGGNFTSYNGTNKRYVCRLNSDGSLDTSFLPTTLGLNQSVAAIFRQSNGKLVVGGSFTYFMSGSAPSYRGAAANYLARLTFAGTLD